MIDHNGATFRQIPAGIRGKRKKKRKALKKESEIFEKKKKIDFFFFFFKLDRSSGTSRNNINDKKKI